MKIAAILENAAPHGGAFGHALTAILQMKEICAAEGFGFSVFTTIEDNVSVLASVGVEAQHFSWTRSDRFMRKVARTGWWVDRQRRKKTISAFERTLLGAGIDLVYFLAQSPWSVVLQKLNYVTTVFDVCHRDTPEFPEVRAFAEFEERERHLKNNLAQAVAVVTESRQLSERIARRYGVDLERCIALPMVPPPFLTPPDSADTARVLASHDLEPGFLFYPAQFWSHKNHVGILDALIILRAKRVNVCVVFVGSDQGNRGHVERFIRANDLGDRVRILGFVSADEMTHLFAACSAVIMPTYFGPTNLPPLEAFQAGKPLIYSSHLRDQVGEAAICVDPDDSASIARGIELISDPDTRARLEAAGKRRLGEIRQERNEAERLLVECLHRFERRMRCWA